MNEKIVKTVTGRVFKQTDSTLTMEHCGAIGWQRTTVTFEPNQLTDITSDYLRDLQNTKHPNDRRFQKVVRPDSTVINGETIGTDKIRRTGSIKKRSGITVYSFAECNDHGELIENGRTGYRAGYDDHNGPTLSPVFVYEYDAVDWALHQRWLSA